jgi:hypothetical protein
MKRFCLASGPTVLFLCLGCGGAAPSPPLTPPTLEGAEAEVRTAEDQLRAALGPFGQPMPEQPAAAPAPPPPPAPAEPQKAAPLSESRAGEEGGAGRCQSACRALGSMQRATDHLCHLSGEADGRCAGARERSRRASDHVRAQCPRCAP